MFYENILDLRLNYNVIWDTKDNIIKPVNNFRTTKLKYELLKARIDNKKVLFNELVNSITITKGNSYKIK